MKEDLLKLDKQICFPLYALSREVIKLYKPLLDPFDLTYTQYITLMVLWETPEIHFKTLGEILHLDSGTLTPVVKKLENRHLLEKYRTKEDDRKVMVKLTDEGHQLKEEIVQVPEALFLKIKGHEDTLKSLKASLDILLKESNNWT